jgi:putative ABC transport system permease protein
MGQRWFRLARGIYWTIVQVYPRIARDRFGEEQIRLFEDLWRQERPRAPLRAAAWTIRQIVRAIGVGASLHVARWWRRVSMTAGGRGSVGADFTYAIRGLRRTPWYVCTTVGVLAAGMALATTAFAVVDGVLFKPLPFPRTESLFLVRPADSRAPVVEPPPAAGWDLAAWRGAVPDVAMTGMGAPGVWWRSAAGSHGSMSVDEHFFDVLGVRPALGRGFTDDDFDFDWSGGPAGASVFQAIVISHRAWQLFFGGDPSIIDRPVTARFEGDRAIGYRVRGILPPDFVFPLDVGDVQPDALVPQRARDMQDAFAQQYFVVMRVPDATSVPGVHTRLRSATRRLTGTTPFRDPHLLAHAERESLRARFDDVSLERLADHLGRRSRRAFALVAAAAGLLLALACVNVAGLAAARNADRSRELALRRALGASGWSLTRGLVVEVSVIVALAATLAVLAVRPLLAWTVSLLPASVALLKLPALDARVVAAAGLLGLAAIALVAIWPARIATHADVSPALGRSGSTATHRRRRSTFTLVALQVGLGFVLLTAGALTVSSAARAWSSDTGYDRSRLILLEVFLKKSTPDDARAQLDAIFDRLRQTADVVDVAATTIPLFGPGRAAWTSVKPRGWTQAPEGVASRAVSASFFTVTGLRVIEGRGPTSAEWRDDARVAIVSERAARIMWPDRPAVGQTLVPVRADRRNAGVERVVTAVVADARYEGIDREPVGDVYLPGAIGPSTYGSFVLVRTAGDPAPIVPTLVSAATGRGARVDRAATLAEALFVTVKHRALPAWLFGSLGIVALVVLGAGVLGLLAMTVAQRRREVGIRCALGATSNRVVGTLLAEQMRAVATGLLVGAVASAWAVRGLEAQLYQVRAYDPAVWGGVVTTVLAVAVAATLVPAWRASREDPVRALRVE